MTPDTMTADEGKLLNVVGYTTALFQVERQLEKSKDIRALRKFIKRSIKRAQGEAVELTISAGWGRHDVAK